MSSDAVLAGSLVARAMETLVSSEIDCPEHGRQKAVSVMGRPVRCVKCLEEKVKQEDASVIKVRDVMNVSRQFNLAMKNSNIPVRYLEASFENYLEYEEGQHDVYLAVRRYANDVLSGVYRSLTLYGLTGTGKTHLSVAIMQYLLREGKTAAYVSFPDLLDEFRKANSFGSSITHRDLSMKYAAPDILVIDEIGVMTGGRSEEEAAVALFEVVNARSNEMKPVVVCTNLAMDEFKCVVGDRVLDRLREGRGLFIPCKWKSYRKVGSNE